MKARWLKIRDGLYDKMYESKTAEEEKYYGDKVSELYDRRRRGMAIMSKVAEYQPVPQPGQFDVTDQVIEDFKERSEFGKKKHGTYLQTFNGRDALMDAYQEAIDLVMYLRQALMERDQNVHDTR